MPPLLNKSTGPVIVLALGLCLAATTPAAGAESAAFTITEGRVSGAISERPLVEALELFTEATGLDYEAPEELLGLPVSGRFDGATAAEALQRLLRSFNYLAVSGTDGAIASLSILGLRSSAPTAPAAPAGRAGALTQPEIYALSDEELLEEAEYLDLEVLAEEAGVPFEALYRGDSESTGMPELDINVLRHLLERRALQ